jgi:hypothetical protein
MQKRSFMKAYGHIVFVMQENFGLNFDENGSPALTSNFRILIGPDRQFAADMQRWR